MDNESLEVEQICWFCENETAFDALASGRPLARLENRPTPLICNHCADKYLSLGSEMHDRCDFCGQHSPVFTSAERNIKICSSCCGVAIEVLE